MLNRSEKAWSAANHSLAVWDLMDIVENETDALATVSQLVVFSGWCEIVWKGYGLSARVLGS